MLRWLRRFQKTHDLPPLTGAPAVRRLKTYSAESGYVYQYYFEGRRLLMKDGEPVNEYVFEVSADRRQYHSVSVLVRQVVLDEWCVQHRRDDLSSSQRHGIAKMALFAAFDERSRPEEMRRPVEVTGAGLERIAEAIDL
ncbi:MAG: hypothetical protein SFV54_25985 [Bryobacteraceae bacterium]|nr:hypothetical protein [Bryobacteraceae bacterium]